MSLLAARCLFKVGAQIHRTSGCSILSCRSPYARALVCSGCFWTTDPTPRMITTIRGIAIKDERSLALRVLDKLKFTLKKYKLKGDAFCLYECVADKVDYEGFTKELGLPDTFQTWFVLTELHVWMLMVRAMANAESGRAIRNSMVEALWADVAQRVKKLGSEHLHAARSQVLELSEQFQASLVSYDEGLLSSDTVLASAVWRRIFSMEYPEPHHLECMVRYIRKTVYDLDKLDLENIILRRRFEWLPVNEVFGKLTEKKL